MQTVAVAITEAVDHAVTVSVAAAGFNDIVYTIIV